jgi:hypothetical protein
LLLLVWFVGWTSIGRVVYMFHQGCGMEHCQHTQQNQVRAMVELEVRLLLAMIWFLLDVRSA